MEDQESTKKEEYLLRKKEKERELTSRIRQRKIRKIAFLALPIFLLAGGIFIWLNYSPGEKQTGNIAGTEKPKITVFYSPTCACCKEYLSYLKRNGFEVDERKTQDMLSIKEKYQIPSEMESCHTAVIGDYFIEGHMPIEAINKLLAEKPDILGIALPGMPSGSPGMGGIKKEAFKIYGLPKVGEILEFMSI